MTIKIQELDNLRAENAVMRAALEEILAGNRNGWIARVAREAIDSNRTRRLTQHSADRRWARSDR